MLVLGCYNIQKIQIIIITIIINKLEQLHNKIVHQYHKEDHIHFIKHKIIVILLTINININN
jgi:hypothetical protein